MILALVRTKGEVNYHLDTDSRDASLLVPTGCLSIVRISGGLWGWVGKRRKILPGP